MENIEVISHISYFLWEARSVEMHHFHLQSKIEKKHDDLGDIVLFTQCYYACIVTDILIYHYRHS